MFSARSLRIMLIKTCAKSEEIDILCLCSWHSVGGAESIAAYLTRGFRERGYRAALGFLFEREPEARHGIDDYFVVSPGRPKSPMQWFRFFSHCHREIARRRPKVAIGFHPMANIMGALLVGSRSGGRFVGSQHNPAFTQSKATGWIEGVLGGTRLYYANIAVAKAVAESYGGHSASYKGKLVVSYNNSPRLPEVTDTPSECRERLGIGPGNPVLGCVGRLHEQKNFALAIRVAQGLSEAHLYVAGDGPQRQALRQLANKLGIAERIHFMGMLQAADVGRFYKAIDLLLMPSNWEGCPIVMLEAMLAGVPIIASDIPVLREIGGDAAVYCAFDPVAWQDSIRRIDKEAKKRLTAAGRLQAESFARESMVDNYLRIAGLPAYKDSSAV